MQHHYFDPAHHTAISLEYYNTGFPTRFPSAIFDPSSANKHIRSGTEYICRPIVGDIIDK